LRQDRLLNGSFPPDHQIRKLRTYIRLHDNLVASHTEAVHHMQKALFEMNVQLTNVISDITARKRRLGTLISAPMGLSF